ncbi:MAG TPA: hypothetical protein ENF81_05800 [Thermotogaceae bacterium]|nr:hypothetical protein [Thermotogaceae bacterium]
MALHKTNYGLIYNDDGSLCVTIRDDDVPFSGVRSFAVEEWTTNYFGSDAWNFDSDQSTFYPYALASGKTWEDCWDESQRAYIGGDNLTVYRIYTQSIDLGQVYSAGTKITVSWKHKGYLWFVRLFYSENGTDFTAWNKDTDDIQIYGDASLDFWEGSNGLHIKINGIRTNHSGHPEQLLDKWYDVKITYTLPTDARYIKFVWDFYWAYKANNGKGVSGYIHHPQLEVKPFATSFVDGSRPRGKLHIPSNSLGFNPPADDWVIAYWKKPIGTHIGDLNGYNIDSLGEPTSGNLYIWWGKNKGTNELWLNVWDGSSVFHTAVPLDVNDFFNKWHFIVLTKVGDVFTLYYDGEQILQMIKNVSALAMPTTGLLLADWIGNSAEPCTSLFSNLYIGKAKDENGHLIWDESYIQQLYQAKRPFSVPPKLPIL